LRLFGRTHVERTRQWMNDPVLMRVLDRVHVITAEEHEAWFQGLASRHDCMYFAIELAADCRHIGNVWLWAIDERHRRAEVRIVIGDPDATGHGWGTDALRMVVEEAFRRMALHKLYAYVLAINPRAERAFVNAGFTQVGRLRDDRWSDDRFVDVLVFECLA